MATFFARVRRPERRARHTHAHPGHRLPPPWLESLERRTLLAFAVTAAVETDPVPHSGDAADDPAIWVHPTDPAQSTIIGSDKAGGVGVYDLAGNELQYLPVGMVNNVDLRHGFPLGGGSVDLVVGSNRSRNALDVYKVDPATRLLENVAARRLASGLSDVYGLALYHSPATGRFYAFTSDRNDGRVEQWELFDDGAGRVDGRVVRSFDAGTTVEGMVADDETGALYAGEETRGLWKYGAEPADGTVRTLLDATGAGGRLTADLEGLAIYYAAGGAGYLLASNQGANEYMIYDRLTGGFIDRFKISGGATTDGVNDTDGLDVVGFGLGPLFPEGLFVVQDGSNSGANQNFKIVDWGDIARAATPALQIDTAQDPRTRGGPAVPRPAEPGDLSAAAVSSRRVDLAWADHSDNEYGFRVERSTDGTSWTRLATVSATTYSDASAPPSSTLLYRVLAFNAAGDSPPSNVATATTPWEPTTTAVTLVPAGSVWQYLNDGSNQGTAWAEPGFDDSAWGGGPAQLGSGDGDEATAIGPGGTPSFITSYFRHTFDVPDPAAVTELTLSLVRDDGAVVYLNGAEVVRSNMPAGAITYTTGAAASVGPGVENAWHAYGLDPAALVAGRNVLAVEVHQINSASGDTSFDLRLEGQATGEAPAPPSNLAATAVAADTVDLAWDDNSDNETGFRIERTTPGTGWAGVATAGAGVTRYRDTGLSPDTTYSYRVLAVNPAGESAPSAAATVTTPAPPADVTLVGAGSVWKYLGDGSDQGTGWRANDYNDTNWLSGPAQLGYGEGDELTVIPGAGSGFVTTYFRHGFSIADPTAFSDLTLRLLRDDGAVVYLNGIEVARSNMPAGAITGTTHASALVSGAGENAWHSFKLSPSLLVSGINVLAVEVHQNFAASSDVSFDLALSGTPAAAPPDEVVYSGPLVITRGGTYSGNWESPDPNVPAVTVSTAEPVVIEHANVRGRGVLIRTVTDHTNLTVRNTRGFGVNPDVYGASPGRFLEANRFSNVVVENNYLEGTGGIALLDYAGDFTPANSVRVVGNSAMNIDGRRSDGAGGFLDFNERTRVSDGFTERGYQVCQFLRLSRVQQVPGVEVAWNQVINEPGKSRVDDNISVYKSSGTAPSPIRIHDNFIRGAYTVRPWQGGTTTDGTWVYDWGFAGGGILVGDGNGGTAYVQVYDNQVVSTTNYGIAIAQGHDASLFRNRVVSSGRLPDGRPIADQNVGLYIWDFNRTGSLFYNNSAYDNQVGWVGAAGGRNDWWVPDASSFENNTRWPGQITLQTEADEATYWRDKLASAGVSVGAA